MHSQGQYYIFFIILIFFVFFLSGGQAGGFGNAVIFGPVVSLAKGTNIADDRQSLIVFPVRSLTTLRLPCCGLSHSGSREDSGTHLPLAEGHCPVGMPGPEASGRRVGSSVSPSPAEPPPASSGCPGPACPGCSSRSVAGLSLWWRACRHPGASGAQRWGLGCSLALPSLRWPAASPSPPAGSAWT